MTAVHIPQGNKEVTEDVVSQARRQNILLEYEWTALTLKRQGRGWVVVVRDRQRLHAPFALYQQRLLSEHWCVTHASWRGRLANILYRREVGTTGEQGVQQAHPTRAGAEDAQAPERSKVHARD